MEVESESMLKLYGTYEITLRARQPRETAKEADLGRSTANEPVGSQRLPKFSLPLRLKIDPEKHLPSGPDYSLIPATATPTLMERSMEVFPVFGARAWLLSRYCRFFLSMNLATTSKNFCSQQGNQIMKQINFTVGNVTPHVVSRGLYELGIMQGTDTRKTVVVDEPEDRIQGTELIMVQAVDK